jgi:hypothetical protein
MYPAEVDLFADISETILFSETSANQPAKHNVMTQEWR